MNSFNYMDKQITELSNPRTPAFFNDHDYKEQEQADEDNDQDHGFHFHPFRSLQSPSKPLDGACLRGWNSMDRIDSAQLSGEEVKTFCETEMIARIDQKLKEHTDVLLHSVEYLSARVSQIETRVRQVQNSFDNLKESIEFSHGKTDGKLRELENILLEVHGGIKDLKDKQEIAEAQSQLAKLRMSNDGPKLERENSMFRTSSIVETSSSISQQSNKPPPNPVVLPQPATAFSCNITNMPLQNHPPMTPIPSARAQIAAPSSSNLPLIPSQLPQNAFPSISKEEPCYTLPVSGTGHQQFVLPTPQAQQNFHPDQPSQSPPHLPLNPHPPQFPQMRPPFSMVEPRVDNYQYYHEEQTYSPSHNFQKSSQLLDRSLPPQIFSIGTRDYHYPPHNSSSIMKLLQPSPSPLFTNNGTNYSKLPTARALPHAIPTASAVDGGTESEGSGNRVSEDDVIDKVVAMGFRRDTVRATAKKLTDSGQSVDLNVVLDKLMNNG